MNDQDRETLAARADFATTQKELAKLQLEHRAVEAEVERLRATLQGIADAKPEEWDMGDSPDTDFRLWAQSRARWALKGERRSDD